VELRFRGYLQLDGLSAESAAQQSPGRKPRERFSHIASPARAAQPLCRSFRAYFPPITIPGAPEPASRALSPRALLRRAFGAKFIQRCCVDRVVRWPLQRLSQNCRFRMCRPGGPAEKSRGWAKRTPGKDGLAKEPRQGREKWPLSPLQGSLRCPFMPGVRKKRSPPAMCWPPLRGFAEFIASPSSFEPPTALLRQLDPLTLCCYCSIATIIGLG